MEENNINTAKTEISTTKNNPQVVNPDIQQNSNLENTDLISKKKFPKILKLIIPVIILIIFGIISYFLIDKFNTPVKVKEKTSISHPLFQHLDRTNMKIIDHLKEAPDSDGDSLERYARKGQDLIDFAKKDLSELKNNQQDLKQPALKEYRKNINDYITQSEKIIVIEEANVKMSNAYKSPLESYKTLTVEISGASSYIYSDPNKYLSTLQNAINDEEKIITDLKKVDAGPIFKDVHSNFIDSLESEAKFLTQLKDAVESRDSTRIAQSTKEYTQRVQDIEKEKNRLNDEIDNKIDEVNDDLVSTSEKVKDEYSNLKTQYKF